MLTYGNASSAGNVAVFCRQRELSSRQLFIHMCVCVSLQAFEFSVSTVYVNGHVGLSGVVVTLT